jgi:hypothetical protein
MNESERAAHPETPTRVGKFVNPVTSDLPSPGLDTRWPEALFRALRAEDADGVAGVANHLERHGDAAGARMLVEEAARILNPEPRNLHYGLSF